VSDVTTLIVVPDTTYLSVEVDESTLIIDGDTFLVVDAGETTVISDPDTTQIETGETVTVVFATDQTQVVGSDSAGPQGPAGAPGPPGPPGGTGYTVTAGEALSAGRIITLATDGKAYYYNPDLAGYGKAVGMTSHAAIAGADIIIVVIGPVTLVGAGFTPGQRHWAGTNGTLLTTPPVSGVIVPIGYAVDADVFNVQIESYLEW
jgi:hypothetical protein